MDRFPPYVTLPAEGSRVELVRWAPSEVIDDNLTVPPGTQGTVVMANDLNICVRWDNGSGLNLQPVDQWKPVPFDHTPLSCGCAATQDDHTCGSA